MVTETDEPTAEESLGTRSDIEEVSACKRRMKASVPAEKVREELDRNYKDLTRTVQVPGFRRGRVPRKLLESRYGQEVESEVKDSLVNSSFSEVVDEKDLKVCTSPKFENVEFEAGSDLKYEAEFEVRPQFDLPKYKGVEVPADKVQATEVADEEIDGELEQLRKRLGTFESIEVGNAGEDDHLSGSYVLLGAEDAELKGETKAHFQPSSNVLDQFFVEGLKDKVAEWGATSDEPLKLDVTVPPQFPDEVLRGQELRLHFSADSAHRSKLPELDEEFAKSAGKESLDDLKDDIRTALSTRKEREAEKATEEFILEHLAGETEMEVPEGLIELHRQRQLLELEQTLISQGMSPDEVREFIAKEGASVGDEKDDEAIRLAAKKGFILEAIAEKEKVFVTEQDVQQRLITLAKHYGVSPAQLRDEMERRGSLGEWRQTLRHEKVRAFLRDRVKMAASDSSSSSSDDSKEADEKDKEKEETSAE